jgi:hypothetical protein
MTGSNKIKFLSLGLVVGCILTLLIGFNFGGWVTGSKSLALIEDASVARVTAALLPRCVSRAKKDPAFDEKLGKIKTAAAYKQVQLISAENWAELPGTNAVNRSLATACIKELTQK